jgi:hypothetical protein
MLRDIEMQHLATAMFQYDEHKQHFHRTFVPPSVPYIPDKLILSTGFQFAKLLAFPITKVNNSLIRLIRNVPC